MPIQREFLGWQQPALISTSNFLLLKYLGAGGLVDLSNVTLVLPSSRAGRRLREILLAEVDRRRQAIFPPRITTTGALPEFLYERKRPFASPLVQQLAWAEALRTSNRAKLKQVIAQLPSSLNDPHWLELASMLQTQHRELAGDALDFSDVAEQGQKLESFHETKRWETLAAVQKRYLKLLDELHLWDRQTARLFALQHRECMTHAEVILVGAVDMNRTMRQMLDQVVEREGRITAFVFAPRGHAERFDEHGCVVPASWESFRPVVTDDQIVVADDLANQADAVLKCLFDLGTRYRTDEIVIGVPQPDLLPMLENKLSQVGLVGRWGAGHALTVSRPLQLLRCIADCVQTGHLQHFAELLRHPDVEHWLYRRQLPDGEQQRGALVDFDNYLAKHFAHHLRVAAQIDEPLPPAIGALRNLLQPLFGGEQPPSEWADHILNVLTEIYREQTIHMDATDQRATLQACEGLYAAFDELRSLPAALALQVSAATALLMAIHVVQAEQVPPPAEPQAIELVGWLELPLDDSPAMLVTYANEGTLPQATAADMFLPNRLRSELGIDDNRRRYARDAYGLQLLAASRPWLRIIVGRRSANGDPLKPSRLLFACDDETIAKRCERFFGPQSGNEVPAYVAVARREESAFAIPCPLPLETPLNALAVTGFRTFLKCPYQFYLEHVLRLKHPSVGLQELDPSAFGELTHHVLDAFGNDAIRDSDRAEEIAEFLVHRLHTLAAERFGDQPRVALRIQLRQLEMRLRVFAKRQAEWRDQGWQILHVEKEHDGTPFLVDGEPFLLRGKIDRIDFNFRDGTPQYAVLDYKTSSKAKSPEKAHRQKKRDCPPQWIDLQLPLYETIARAFDLPGPFRFGYISLPDDPNQTSFELADWTERDLRSAREAAEDVIRKIRRGEFWPPATAAVSSRGFERPVGPICQDGVFQSRVAEPGKESVA